jgi:RNA polymerase sigma-70 factor (ECF subfamily)
MLKTRTNAEWVDFLAHDGDPSQVSAFEELGRVLYPVVSAYLRRRSPSLPGLSGLSETEQSELARDFVQQTLEQVYRELDAYRGDGAFLSWATTIALRFAGQELRRAHWQTQRFDPTKDERSYAMALVDGGQLPENHVIAGEIQRAVKLAIKDDMSEQQQRVFNARFVQGRTYDEIAAAEGISASAAYQRVHQARLKIKHRLCAAGFEAWELA